MSNQLTITVRGDAEIKAALKKAGETGREALRPAIESAAQILADAVQGNARNSWLKSNVQTKVVFDDEKGVTSIVGVTRDDDHPGNLALWFEYGTQSGMTAQPFMRPALDEKGEAATKAITEVLRRELHLD